MTYEFSISKSSDHELSKSIDLDNSYILNYSNNEYLNDVTIGEKRLICYGYTFDIRYPQISIEDTLKSIIERNSFKDDVAYLNGQYILIYIDGKSILTTVDATSLVPVFIDEEFNEITNIPVENNSYKFLNSNLIIDLNDKSLHRINVKLSGEDVSGQIINLLENQYKYFLNKKLVMNFKMNNYMKSLISIMKPSLYGNFLSVYSDNNATDQKFADSIRKDFNMEFINEEDELVNVYYLRNQLFDFKHFLKKGNNNTDKLLQDAEFKNLSELVKLSESNILTRKRIQSIELNKTGLLFDPFNVHVIYQTLLENNKQLKNITSYITQELLPSINYYDFVNRSLLRETNNMLAEEIERLKSNQITANNEQFLLKTKLSYFKVSENLDGKLKENEILVYPATQEIKAEEKFVVYYENPGDGMVFVKSYFSNKKNGQTILVNIDGKEFTVDELYKGILINVKSRLKITMKYKNSRHSLPWQKAGTLLIRKN